MKLRTLLYLTCFILGLSASAKSIDIPIKASRITPTNNVITCYTVSMQSADYEVATYGAIQDILAIDLKLNGDLSETVNYQCLEMVMDYNDFETAEYKFE